MLRSRGQTLAPARTLSLWALCAALGILSASCGGLRAEMAHTSDMDCGPVIDRHAAIARNPDYAKQPLELREGYELRVVHCDLVAGKLQPALDIAHGWSDRIAVERDQIVARAEAGLGHDDAARTALEAVATRPQAEADFFAESPEFVRYRGEEWFVSIALQVWSRSKAEPLDSFARKLVGRDQFLSLKVAAADPHRESGSWVVWTGVVRDARLDQEGDQTLLYAEGVDVTKELRSIDAVRSRLKGDSVVSTATESTYGEVLIPNGRKFFIRYPRASELLVGMRAVTALGHFEGRDPSGMPVVKALAVVKRDAKTITEKKEE